MTHDKRRTVTTLYTIIVTLILLLAVGQDGYGQTPTPEPAPAPTPTEEERRLEQENRILTLRKNQATLKQEIRDAQPTASATPLEGKTELENVFIETQIVTYKAMADATDRISEQIRSRVSPDAPTIVIYNAEDVKGWRYYKAMYPAFKERLNNFKANYNTLLTPLPAVAVSVSGAPAVISAFETGSNVLRSFVDLISIFRTDTKIEGKEVTIEESALIAELFRGLKSQYPQGITLYYPKVFPPRIKEPESGQFISQTVKLIEEVIILKAQADSVVRVKSRIKEASNRITELEKAIAKNGEEIEKLNKAVSDKRTAIKKLKAQLKTIKSKSKKAAVQAEIAKLEEEIQQTQEPLAKLAQNNSDAEMEKGELETEVQSLKATAEAKAPGRLEELKALNANFDKFFEDIVKVDTNTGLNLLALFVKAEDLDKALLKNNTYWLEIKSVKAGGNNRTRRNLIRYFMGAKVDHSGGVIIEYTLYNKDGSVVCADKLSIYNGYLEPKKIRALN